MSSGRHCPQITPSSTCMVRLELLFPLKDKALANHRKTIFWLFKVKLISALLSNCLNSLSPPSTGKNFLKELPVSPFPNFKNLHESYLAKSPFGCLRGLSTCYQTRYLCCLKWWSLLVKVWLLGGALPRWLGSGKGHLRYSSLFLTGQTWNFLWALKIPHLPFPPYSNCCSSIEEPSQIAFQTLAFWKLMNKYSNIG